MEVRTKYTIFTKKQFTQSPRQALEAPQFMGMKGVGVANRRWHNTSVIRTQNQLRTAIA